MKRSHHADPHTASLPLPMGDDAITERDAFALTPELQRHLTYEQAMQQPFIRIALKNTAEAMNKARRAHDSADICTPR
jgi:hypothetical protein